MEMSVISIRNKKIMIVNNIRKSDGCEQWKTNIKPLIGGSVLADPGLLIRS